MTTNLEITGMSCQNCVGHVTRALESLPGVSSVDVSLEGGRAVVEYDDTRVSVQRMIEAVEEEGYEARAGA